MAEQWRASSYLAERCNTRQDDRIRPGWRRTDGRSALVQILVYGAVISAIYAMLAVGSTLIFGVARILNLAHGSFYALGAYAMYTFTAVAHLPLWLASVLAVSVRCCFRHGDGAGARAPAPTLHASSVANHPRGRSYGRAECCCWCSVRKRAMSRPWSTRPTISPGSISAPSVCSRWGARYDPDQLVAVHAAYAARSAILAISQDAEAAQYMGIRRPHLLIVMGLSAGIAAAAGVLVAPFQTVIPGMGLLPLVKAFAIVVVGGLGSIPGSIVALSCSATRRRLSHSRSRSMVTDLSVAAVLITLILRPADSSANAPPFESPMGILKVDWLAVRSLRRPWRRHPCCLAAATPPASSRWRYASGCGRRAGISCRGSLAGRISAFTLHGCRRLHRRLPYVEFGLSPWWNLPRRLSARSCSASSSAFRRCA